MTDTVLAQAAYDAFAAASNHIDSLGMPLPSWEGLGEQTQAATLAAVRAVAAPADQAVRAVQAWAALDVHRALGKPVQAADHQGHPAWGEWWEELISDIRAVAERAAAATPTVSTEQPSPLCLVKATRPDGSTVTCGKFADHVSPWHRRGSDSWRYITKFGTGKGTSPRTHATQG